MDCPECGAQTVPNANFCGNCRRSLITTAPSINPTPYSALQDKPTSSLSNPIPYSRPPSSRPKRKRGLLLAGLLVVLLIVGGTTFAIMRLPPAPPSVVITYPTHGSPVSIKTIIQGTASSIPNTDELWVLIVPDGLTAYYPQEPGPVEVRSDGKWSSNATVGQAQDSGRGFTVFAALVNQEGSPAIHAYVSGSDVNGLDPLPRGVQLMQKVHVVRT
jgi:hypothetical protein